ncbi:unnamed protein product [Caenorhabditis sp. 36 PRJEB53466]|nr:unnamed protein product [Caenorhabditis sp. 36 PRJEB53466]
MSRHENLLTKENWQSFGLCPPGPSNQSGLSIPSAVFSANSQCRPQTARTSKQTWTCSLCKKDLSSKRSYTEHMNIHNKTRPFRCEHCTYAAASQMTLHRHKLRNHTPKTEWGYRCPYCEDAFMEPAGFQQHVQIRHPGKSATYGCPFRICKFTSKSQRHFREHLLKHDRNDKIEGGVDPCALSNQQLVRYMINDEIGHGFERSMVPSTSAVRPKVLIRARRPIAPKLYVTPENAHSSAVPTPVSSSASNGRTGEGKIVWHVEKVAVRKVPSPPLPPPTVVRYYIPSASMPGQSVSAPRVPYRPHPHLHHQMCRAEPLPQTYDQIPREFEIEADESDFEAEMAEMEEDSFDEGPPVLDRQEDPSESPWSKSDNEISGNDVGIFPNGFIDDELD